MRPGEIYLATFPFGDTGAMKLRPVLLLTPAVGTVPEALVAYISSVVRGMLMDSDIVPDPKTPDGATTRLKTTSVLRLHKLATIHQSSIARRLGHLAPSHAATVSGKLRRLLNL